MHGKQLLLGHAVAAGTQTFQARNPGTAQTLPTPFFEATPEEVDRAMQLAAAAFASFRITTGGQRADLLRAIAESIEAIGDVLIEQAQAESGLPVARLQGERARTLNQIRIFADMAADGSWQGARIDTSIPDRQPVPKPDVRARLTGLGPVVVFGASNFPLAISVAGTDTVSALAAGCSVVVKAHPSHPGTSELVGEAIARAIA
ncbi:MAG: aldehyde dehydrogenase family protein, partial [Deltaproteobacteria bacterium]|nr:aldehyde dehydrogenase family protein [Deltaproteobacteria bacterium]